MTAAELLEQYSPRLAKLAATPATRQLIRYAFAGLCVTQFAACVYSAAVLFLRIDPLTANVLSTGCGLGVGYLVHSRWSFATGATSNEGWQVGRFLLASLFAFLINSLWVWLLVNTLHLPPLTPVPLMMLATPWISFLLNRYWVFKAA
jgi:putative flippase GtrA